MEAIRYHGQKDIRLDRVDVPICGSNQVKVCPLPTVLSIYGRPTLGFVDQVGQDSKPPLRKGNSQSEYQSQVNVLHTDLHEYLDGPAFFPTKPHPLTGEKLPIILGHEFSGTVVEVGTDVNDIHVGQNVAVLPPFYDHTCGACVKGMLNCCESIGAIGCSGRGGGLAEYIVTERKAAYTLPDSVSLAVGALVEPLSVAWHAIDTAMFQPGQSVLIMGAGPIGIGLIQCLRARGCEKIIISEISRQRKTMAQEFGAHYVLDPTQEDVVPRTREICDGQGADIVFDAAGVQSCLDQAIQALRARGTLVNVALWEKPPTIDANSLLFREKVYKGTFGYLPDDFQAVIDAIASKQLNPERMITGRVGLHEVEEKAFKALIQGKDKHTKILVEVNREH
ncbi:chlorophyll synthesis pathway protein BchC [Cladophialophora immunda]|uniref:Chlorophyll synthesis pathway protein BchC n=1 Tax=Cladophialophora immunda TaxID=569365 RepID=A0A0D2CJC5_9EURO|nr:chlorophyll synthesis pathway protein BchC [Cladophialophora immunda]KIW30215.1 chlorophyll synthesis pathway protein BchC [Cladophialophora immunda]